MGRSLLQAFNPFERHLRRQSRVVRTLRLALVLCAVLIPVFGVALHRADATYIDPWWLRGAWVAAALITLAGSFGGPVTERRAHDALVLYLCGVLGWIGGLVYVNDLQAEIAIGFVFTYVAVGVMLGFAYGRVRVYGTVMGLATALALVVAIAVAEPETSPAVFVLSVVSAGITLLIATYARMQMQHDLREREDMLDEAERLGQIGTWSRDLTTGRRVWSDGMYRLLGESPREGRPPRLREILPQTEQEALIRAERRLLSGEASQIDQRYTIVRSDGVRRDIRSIVRLSSTIDGEPDGLLGVAIDVTAQAEHERGLVAARRKAEEAATLKTAILENMSHEIRTPLTAVIGYAQILREELGEPYVDLVRPIESGGERLLATLNAVLDLARMKAERPRLVSRPFDLCAVVREVAAGSARQAELQGLEFQVAMPPRPVVVSGSPGELTHALGQLVNNAVKFTERGRVVVRVVEGTEAACVDVIDTGRGMDPEFVPKLFEPFWQESVGNSRSHEGPGLGLAVSHHLITAMEGTIEVESAVGRGATFSVRLPLAPKQGPEAPPATPSAALSGAPSQGAPSQPAPSKAPSPAWIALAPEASGATPPPAQAHPESAPATDAAAPAAPAIAPGRDAA